MRNEEMETGANDPGRGRRPARKNPAVIFLLAGMIMGAALSAAVPRFLQMRAGAEQTRLMGKTMGDGESAVSHESMEKLEVLEQYLRNYYYEPEEIDVQTLENGMYKGLMSSLGDPYTVYYSKEEYDSLMEETSGAYGGIGAYIGVDKTTNAPILSNIIRGTPAESAGLKKGDIICEVDGTDTLSMQTEEVAALVKGAAGTEVKVRVLRDKEYLDFSIKRAKINIPTVESEMLSDGIGYLQISMFSDQTPGQFDKALADLRKEGMASLLLDLRGNSGGTVSSVTQIASWLLPKGRIFYMEDRDGRREEYNCPGADFDLPVIVLVDGYTASASEILAGAIQDAGVGKLLGTQTYGKGVVQNVYPLDDGSAVKITIADYYTREGRSINKQGLAPDYDIEFDVEKYEDDETDNQLEEAKAILLGKEEAPEKEASEPADGKTSKSSDQKTSAEKSSDQESSKEKTSTEKSSKDESSKEK